MGMVSKKEVLSRLSQHRDAYREDTDEGQSCREVLKSAINTVRQLECNCAHLSASECATVICRAQAHAAKLADEKRVEVLEIKGYADTRYTRCPERAKAILQEEMDHVLDSVFLGTDGESVGIKTIEVRESDLQHYTLEQ